MAESLEELRTAFEEWRSKKRHAREAVPRELLERARRAMGIHGPGAVRRAVKIEGARLRRSRPGVGGSVKGNKTRTAPVVPSFSRIAVGAPAGTTSCPFAEVETRSGLKLRFFAETRETLGLLGSLCGGGGGR